MKQIGDADVLQSKVDGFKKGDGGDSTYLVPELWHRERYRGGEKNWKSCFTVVHGQDCRVFACETRGRYGVAFSFFNGLYNVYYLWAFRTLSFPILNVMPNGL